MLISEKNQNYTLKKLVAAIVSSSYQQFGLKVIYIKHGHVNEVQLYEPKN